MHQTLIERLFFVAESYKLVCITSYSLNDKKELDEAAQDEVNRFTEYCKEVVDELNLNFSIEISMDMLLPLATELYKRTPKNNYRLNEKQELDTEAQNEAKRFIAFCKTLKANLEKFIHV